MKTLTQALKEVLIKQGANLVGVGDLSEINPEIRKNMPFGICIVLALPVGVIKGIENAPTMEYYNTYNEWNDKLDSLVTYGAEYLKSLGYQAFPQTGKVVAENETDYSTLLPYKTIATRAGIGWIGKSALLITKEYGGAVRISTILTDAPLEADMPVNEARCGGCMLCKKTCPAEAIKGTNWNTSIVRDELLDPVKCRKTARELSWKALGKEITLCGKCFYVCPYTKAYIKRTERENSDKVY